MRASFCVIAFSYLILSVPSLTGQIKQPYDADPAIVITPVDPGAGKTARLDVYSQCAPLTGPSLLAPGIQNVVSGPADIPLFLATPLTSGQSVCGIETFDGAGALPPVVFPLVIVRAVPAGGVGAAAKLTIEAFSGSQKFVRIDPLVAPAGDTASVDIVTTCAVGGAAAGPSLLAAGIATAVGPIGAPLTLELANAPALGSSLCAVESFSGPTAKSSVYSAPFSVVAAPAAKPQSGASAEDLEAKDKAIRLVEADCIRKLDAKCLAGIDPQYDTFVEAVETALKAKTPPTPSTTDHWFNDYVRRTNWKKSATAYRHPGNFAFSFRGDLTGNVTHERILAGIDVSGASSTDPAAKFLADITLEIPLPGRKTTTPIGANNSIWGYARISSISQPGAISGVSNLPMYVQALTSSAPNAIVQSFEAQGGYEFRLRETDPHEWARRPYVISAIVGGGIITPISTSQAGTPPIYIATAPLQSYYASVAASHPTNVMDQQNSTNVTAACAAPATTCYIAEYPESRQRFYHDYEAGIRFKRYYYNDWNNSFIFPAIFDITLGQNDYVTAGYLRRPVVHLGGSTPIGAIPGLYAYASFDVVIESNSAPNQQFVLQAAPSTITSSSANVAQIFVGQADRDRYRFGIAYDLNTLIKKLAPAKP